MNDDAINKIVECKNWLLSKASEYEKEANRSLFERDFPHEESNRKKQKTILEWTSNLDMLISNTTQ
jgi:hypothetical protein